MHYPLGNCIAITVEVFQVYPTNDAFLSERGRQNLFKEAVYKGRFARPFISNKENSLRYLSFYRTGEFIDQGSAPPRLQRRDRVQDWRSSETSGFSWSSSRRGLTTS